MNIARTEKEYRALSLDSYSTLKLFAESRKKYFKEIVMGEKGEDESSYLTFGSLVDTLCLGTEQDLEDKFAVAVCSPPTGQMFDLVNNLYRHTLKYTENGTVTRAFDAIFEDAYLSTAFDKGGNAIAFKGKNVEKVMDMFKDSDGELYYNELRRNTGKSVVTLGVMQLGEKIKEELYNNDVTRQLLWADGYNQLQIEFEYGGLELKAMLDKVVIDGKNKVIQPVDLKTSSNAEEFHYNFLKYRYDIQAAVYNIAVRKWANENGYMPYKILPMKFVVADSSNFLEPLVYETTGEHLLNALQGFSVKGKDYMGVDEIIDEILHAREYGTWRISKKNRLNKGLVKLNIKYDV